jgi:PucR C-terminal helix-turn-helix domain/GGDEF-like domain
LNGTYCYVKLTHVASTVGLDASPVVAHGLPDWAGEAVAAVDLPELCRRVIEADVAAAFASYARDDAFLDRLRDSVAENLINLRDVLLGRRRIEQIIVDKPLQFGEAQAELVIAQSSLHKSYRTGFLEMWECLNQSLSAAALRAGVATAEAVQASSELSRTIMSYHDQVASQVAQAYTRTETALNQSRERLRNRLVRELIRGEQSTTRSDLSMLGYELDTHHVAIVFPELADSAAARLAVGLRSACGTRDSLVHPLGLGSSALWIGQLGGWSAQRLERLHEVLQLAGVRAAVGGPAYGIDGFRASLCQAEDAERIRCAWGAERAPKLINYADVALDVLLLRDESAAARFVRAELGPLSADTAETARLRETLEASMRYGTHVCTADALQVHEHTVRNRLQRVEEKLGPGWSTRSTEIRVALRLFRLLDLSRSDQSAST